MLRYLHLIHPSPSHSERSSGMKNCGTVLVALCLVVTSPTAGLLLLDQIRRVGKLIERGSIYRGID